MTEEEGYSKELESSFHKLIKKVTEDIENLKFNTAIAAMMTVLNEVSDKGSITKGELHTFITLLNPFAPHLTEEMNQQMGAAQMLTNTQWPKYDPAKCVDDQVEIVIQVCGKIKARMTVPADSAQDDVKAKAFAEPAVAAALEGKQVVKEIFVKGKLYNIVAK